MRLFIVAVAVVLGFAISGVVALSDGVDNQQFIIAGSFMVGCGIVSKLINRGYIINRRKEQKHTQYTRRSTDYKAVNQYYEQHGKDAWPTYKEGQRS